MGPRATCERASGLWCFCGQERFCTRSAQLLFYFTGEFGSVMEGSLSQQDGTSEKVAVKTMKRELPVTHETRSRLKH